MIQIKNSKSAIAIDEGELVSYVFDGQEYIHQKGNKGWRKSDDEMFPIIGPTEKNDFVVHTKNGDAIQDQHGLLRELNYYLLSESENQVKFIKNYKKNTWVKNSKYPSKSTEEFLYWPFDFTFEKKFTLQNDSLVIDFTIQSEEGMPFMLGYHPAFLLSDTGEETLMANNQKITLTDVLNAGSNAFPVLNSDEIVLINNHKKNLQIITKGFHNFMLWTEVKNMLCIEPITQYTSYTNQVFSEENMKLSKGINNFSVTLKVLE
ncbi:aldose 1-epimerase [Polaribacter sp. BAL334]|uniref:aldose 1-epimerase n=1 Tax=Polaribacter sp. BAL334 TaxID=1708178 RepID=UPI0018D25CBE|nr:aldose 1-epimerase [Polaribacter sp. BAL334]MBG7611964.1 aldose 1-epimerase [Polaribacter sp. BAL334]